MRGKLWPKMKCNPYLLQRGIYEAIHEAAAPGLLDECQKLKDCETGKCKVNLSYKLPANNVFHTVRPWNKNENRLNDCYISWWQEVTVYNIKSFTLCCRAIGIAGFDQ